MSTKGQDVKGIILPGNTLCFDFTKLKDMIACRLFQLKGNDIEWNPSVEVTEKSHYYMYHALSMNYILDDSSQMYAEMWNMLGSCGRMARGVMLMKLNGEIIFHKPDSCNTEKTLVRAAIHFFKTTEESLCISRIIMRDEGKEAGKSPWPWGGKYFSVDYKNDDPYSPVIRDY